MIFVFGCLSYFSIHAAPICEDLARASCAPGRYDDGTGVVRSEREVADQLSQYAQNLKPNIDAQVLQLIRSREGQYFKQKAMGALGLSELPVCQSTQPQMRQQCEQNIVEGVSELIQNSTIKSLVRNTVLPRYGNLEDLAFIARDENYLKIVANVNTKIETDLVDKAQLDEIKNKTFPDVKKEVIARLRELNIPSEQLNFMITKINAISFEGSNCPGDEKDKKDFISNLLTSNAYYSPAQNSIKVCAGYLLQSTSAFHIVNTLAHEIAHSIDPCNIDRGPQGVGFHYSAKNNVVKSEQEYPVSKVIQCLRAPTSVAARNFQLEENERIQQQLALQAQQMEQMRQMQLQRAQAATVSGTGGSVTAGLMGMPSPYALGGALGGFGGAAPPVIKPVNFCDKDQIGESFADWVSAETLPRFIKKNYNLSTEQYQTGYSNVKRLACLVPTDLEASRAGNTDEHPIPSDRINKIYLSNPKIREQMGCTDPKNKNAVYCDNVSTYGGGIAVSATSTAGPAGSGGVSAPPTVTPSGAPVVAPPTVQPTGVSR